MKTALMEYIRDIIKECPYLDQYRKGIGVDNLAEDETAYALESVPAASLLDRYIDGTSLRQQAFTFSSRNTYSEDVRQNIENIGFYENFSAWLESISHSLPELDGNRLALKLEALTSGYIYDAQIEKAKYQIECRLLYLQEGE